MTRRRFMAKISRATPALLVSLFCILAAGLVAWGWTALERGAPSVRRASGVLALDEKPTRAALVARGDSIFHGPRAPGTCAVCHGKNGAGSRLGPRLASSRDVGNDDIDSIARLIRLGVYWPPSLMPSMPAFEGVLNRDEIRAVAAYVHSISNRGN